MQLHRKMLFDGETGWGVPLPKWGGGGGGGGGDFSPAVAKEWGGGGGGGSGNYILTSLFDGALPLLLLFASLYTKRFTVWKLSFHSKVHYVNCVLKLVFTKNGTP